MASLVARLSRAVVFRNTATLSRNTGPKSVNVTGLTLSRNAVTSTTGRVLPKPVKVSLYMCISVRGSQGYVGTRVGLLVANEK